MHPCSASSPLCLGLTLVIIASIQDSMSMPIVSICELLGRLQFVVQEALNAPVSIEENAFFIDRTCQNP